MGKIQKKGTWKNRHNPKARCRRQNHLPVGQIESPGDAEDQGKTQGYEGIKRTQGKTGKDDGGPNPHNHRSFEGA